MCILDREISLKHVLWIWDTIFYYEFIEFTFINNKTESDSGKHINRLNFLDMVCLSKEAVNLASKFNGNIKIWNHEESKQHVNYLEK